MNLVHVSVSACGASALALLAIACTASPATCADTDAVGNCIGSTPSESPSEQTPTPGNGDPADPGTTSQCVPATTPIVSILDDNTVVGSSRSTSATGGVEQIKVLTSACIVVGPASGPGERVAGIPAGPYDVTWYGQQVDSSLSVFHWLETSSRDVNLGLLLPLSSSTAECQDCFLTLRIGDLAPWLAGDSLQMFVPDTGVVVRDLDRDALTRPPVAGATALDVGFNWDVASPPLLITGAAYVEQLASRGAYSTVTRVARFGGLAQKQSSTMPLLGRFEDVPERSIVAANLAASQIAAMAPSVNPRATTLGASLAVQTTPGARHGAWWNATDLLVVPPSTADVALGLLTYGDPYPPEWGTFASVEARFVVRYPGGPLSASYLDVEDPATLGDGPILPKIGPVTNALVNGTSAFAAAGDVTPTSVSWDPPTLGTPTAYVVRVWGLTDTSSEKSSWVVVATYTTTSTNAPAACTAGRACVLEIDAIDAAVDLTVSPDLTSVPYASAPVLSGEYGS